jgi:hypothetical protein
MKPLTAQELYKFLNDLINEGNDLSKITINYRTDSDSDVEIVTYVSEDLFDAETNSILESIVLMNDASDYEG